MPRKYHYCAAECGERNRNIEEGGLCADCDRNGRIWAAQQALLDDSFDPPKKDDLPPPSLPSLSAVRGEFQAS